MSQLIRYVCIYNYWSLHIRYQFGCNICMHQILTISMLSCLRQNMSWISSKSNMISLIPSDLDPKISRSYRTQMVLSPSLHALMYQLCILFIKLGTPFIKESGRNGLPYSNLADIPVNLLCHRPQHNDGTHSQCGARKSPVICCH